MALLAIGLGLLALVPPAAALGFFGPRTYLVVSQDPAELRPYGGYVGAYGAVELLFGRINSLDYGDSKDLDTDGARPLFAASESPDFPTAASAMADVYDGATDGHADGVIGLDPAAASGLLDLVGPLTVPGEWRSVTSANLLGIVLEHTQNFDDPDANRKQFVFDLGLALAGQLRALPPTRWPNIVHALARTADERHIQIYLADPILQRVVHALGWDGAYPPPTDDFLAVVDDNVGYNKANLITDQTLDYHVDLDAEGATMATLIIDYNNHGTSELSFAAASMPYLNEVTYDGSLSIYVPAGSQRLSDSSLSDPPSSLGRTVFAEQVDVPPHSQRSLLLRYRLPPRSIQAQRIAYGLLVRKQAGTLATPIHVSVTGPHGWHIAGGEGPEWAAEALLTTDTHFDVVFETSHGG